MSTFGDYFRVTTYGESHGKSVGCIVDGVPPGLELSEKDIQPQMTRRRPGQSALTTPRDEKDLVEIQSGTEFGVTLGTPIGMRVMNQDQRPKDYGKDGATFNGQEAGAKPQRPMDDFPRPSHADWTYLEKYGVKASSGGGRSSARETIGRVAAAGVAEKYLKVAHGVEIVAFTNSVGPEHLFPSTRTHPSPSTNPEFLKLIEGVTRERVDSFLPVRCPNGEAAKRMEELIGEYRDKHDSIGGTVTCVIRNCPSGLGSIHNDPFVKAPAVPPSASGAAQNPSSRPRLTTKTNNSGGVQGGISNGMPIFFTVGFKPPATIGQAQQTTTYDEEEGVLEAKGRHDPCVIPRAVPIVESMAALVVMDAILAQSARQSARSLLPIVNNKLIVPISEQQNNLTSPANGHAK
ncbi:hypothetical protein CBER1_08137 [Cercospora berteroae]|uniref:Chorismate synthase n=1 Tax=Cercospora berteroae TaxID=357750 RepID=A0A2S6CLI4_9PEZI|nr:hypothetical protein CBER1_08137 [Cercospora berteroae]